MKKIIYILIIFSFSRQALGQKEDRIWYLPGEYCSTVTATGAGIDFNSGSPIALTNGAMPYSEGCATQSNRNGSLLFYTNGADVWDKTHNIMFNGSGLGGHVSSQQSAQIIPFVNDSSKFYIFAQNGKPTSPGIGLHYSVVDMTLNGGLGGITSTKAILLQKGTGEALTATKHINGIDYWVITADYDSSIFYSYQITSSGISTPIKTNLGFNSNFDLRIHFNNKGNKIWYTAKVSPYYIRHLANFNLSSGVVSNSIPVDTGFIIDPVEFSPNDSLIYAMSIVTVPTTKYVMAQFKTYAPNIFASRQIIFSPNGYPYFSDLKLAPDGKIYLNRDCADSVDVINSPNMVGVACNWQKNILYLSGKKAYYYFPNEIFQIPFLPLSSSDNSISNKLIKPYPNPASDFFAIEMSDSKFYEINLLNIQGVSILTKRIFNSDKINLTGIPSGIYFIKIVLDNQTYYDKIIVQH